MNTNSFVLSFSEGNVDNEHMDLSNLDNPIKTNNKIPGKFKHELGSNVTEEFLVLKSNVSKSWSQNQIYDNERVEIQKVGSSMSTIEISKRRLGNFDDKKILCK